jgi:phage shock protein E
MNKILLMISLLLICVLTIADKGDSPLIIDVRTTAEWDTGHLVDAKHIEWQDISARISDITTDKDETIYVYCRSGGRSEKAKTILDELGYINVINAGGIADAQVFINAQEN